MQGVGKWAEYHFNNEQELIATNLTHYKFGDLIPLWKRHKDLRTKYCLHLGAFLRYLCLQNWIDPINDMQLYPCKELIPKGEVPNTSAVACIDHQWYDGCLRGILTSPSNTLVGRLGDSLAEASERWRKIHDYLFLTANGRPSILELVAIQNRQEDRGDSTVTWPSRSQIKKTSEENSDKTVEKWINGSGKSCLYCWQKHIACSHKENDDHTLGCRSCTLGLRDCWARTPSGYEVLKHHEKSKVFQETFKESEESE